MHFKMLHSKQKSRKHFVCTNQIISAKHLNCCTIRAYENVFQLDIDPHTHTEQRCGSQNASDKLQIKIRCQTVQNFIYAHRAYTNLCDVVCANRTSRPFNYRPKHTKYFHPISVCLFCRPIKMYAFVFACKWMKSSTQTQRHTHTNSKTVSHVSQTFVCSSIAVPQYYIRYIYIHFWPSHCSTQIIPINLNRLAQTNFLEFEFIARIAVLWTLKWWRWLDIFATYTRSILRRMNRIIIYYSNMHHKPIKCILRPSGQCGLFATVHAIPHYIL